MKTHCLQAYKKVMVSIANLSADKVRARNYFKVKLLRVTIMTALFSGKYQESLQIAGETFNKYSVFSGRNPPESKPRSRASIWFEELLPLSIWQLTVMEHG